MQREQVRILRLSIIYLIACSGGRFGQTVAHPVDTVLSQSNVITLMEHV